MFNRSGLYLFAIIAAVGVPYFMSAEQAGTRARVAHVWDKMFSDTISDRYPRTHDPDSSASPVPGYSPGGYSPGGSRLNDPPWEFRPQERVAQFPVERPPNRGYTSGGVVPSAPRSNGQTFTHSALPQTSYLPPASIAPHEMGGQPLAGVYPDNPLQGIAPEQGATEWKPVGPGGSSTLPVPGALPNVAIVSQSGGLTALPIPHGATQPVGVPDEEGWVTVGPAPGQGGVAIDEVTLPGTTTGIYPGVPPGAQILPGIVVGGPHGASDPRRSVAPQDLNELLSFDHAPGWVVDSWPRVSTHIIQGDLSGMRVPLVSGTDASALAGSLSYYFDRGQKLQRIAFEGATGDPTRLIQLLSTEHRLKAEPSLGGGMFVAYDPPASTSIDDIASVLRLRRTPVVRSARPLQKYLVMLELNRADSGRKISDELSRLLQLDRRSQRWLPTNASTTLDGGSAAPDPSVPLDPRDPFSPANPNDAFLPKPPVAEPQPTASPVPPTRGAIPSDNLFQNSLPRQPSAPAAAPIPVAPNQQLPPPLTTNPLRGVPPST